MLNMLIAMMAKTFDRIHSETAVNFNFLRGRVITTWLTQHPSPPPFNLLTMIFHAVQLLIITPLRICKVIKKTRHRGDHLVDERARHEPREVDDLHAVEQRREQLAPLVHVEELAADALADARARGEAVQVVEQRPPVVDADDAPAALRQPDNVAAAAATQALDGGTGGTTFLGTTHRAHTGDALSCDHIFATDRSAGGQRSSGCFDAAGARLVAARRVADAWDPDFVDSDHTPVVAEFSFRAANQAPADTATADPFLPPWPDCIA